VIYLQGDWASQSWALCCILILKTTVYVHSIELHNHRGWDRFWEVIKPSACSKWGQNLILPGIIAPWFSQDQNESDQPVSSQDFLPLLKEEYGICLSLFLPSFHSLSTVIEQPQNVTSKISHKHTPTHLTPIFYSSIYVCVFTGLNGQSCWSPRCPAGNSTDHRSDLLRSSNCSLPPSLHPPGMLFPSGIWHPRSPTCHSSVV